MNLLCFYYTPVLALAYSVCLNVISDEMEYLMADYSIVCWKDDHIYAVAVAVLCIFLCHWHTVYHLHLIQTEDEIRR